MTLAKFFGEEGLHEFVILFFIFRVKRMALFEDRLYHPLVISSNPRHGWICGGGGQNRRPLGDISVPVSRSGLIPFCNHQGVFEGQFCLQGRLFCFELLNA